jgi:hypothetical protein
MSQEKQLFEFDSQPKTPEELERQRVREEYRTKLAEKLKDPEFRKIEGFPIGTNEAILALSDPPFYTACPNPFFEEWVKKHGKPFDPDKDDYHREPFAADVSEGKNHPIYNAHSYHTKVPHRAIMRYILHYTDPGDVVYDGFCGTGMTGVAAQLCGDQHEVEALDYKVSSEGIIWDKESWEAKQAIEAGRTNPHPHLTEPKPFSKLGARIAILSDLSPAATFITSNYNAPVDQNAFEESSKRIVADVEAKCGWMYATLHREPNRWSAEEWEGLVQGAACAIRNCRTAEDALEHLETLRRECPLGVVNYTVWSDVFICPNCSDEIVFWDAALDTAEGKVLDEFPCPSCKATVTKKQCEHKFMVRHDPELRESTRQAVQVPVLSNYSIGKKRHQKRTDAFDEALVGLADRLQIPFAVPCPRMPPGQESRRNDPIGITHAHHFYTRRNLFAQACLRSMATTPFLKFAAQALSTRATKLNKVHIGNYFHGGGGWNAGNVSGTLYIPSTTVETSILQLLNERLESLGKLIPTLSQLKPTNALVQTCSATSPIPSESASYIFTDPPFGGNLNYSELSFLWEAWLGVITNSTQEAITSPTQKKGLPEYESLMQLCFLAYYQGLKAGRWMTVEFHNSANSVWNAIQEALERVGFVVADVRVLDKGQYSFKQVNSSGATKQDLVISCYKPTSRFTEKFEQDKGTPRGVREFVEQHLEMLPVAPTTLKGSLESLAERTLGVLYDRMIGYHLVRGARIPVSASEFRALLDDMCYERDGMFFLPSQVVRYDALKARGVEVEQLSLFVRDEKSAVHWVRNELAANPLTLGELTPKFMQAIQEWGPHEVVPELRDLLQQYFIREVDETWVVPDPDNERHLEEVRRKAMLREFQEYIRRPGQLKTFRTEAMLVGFAHCWETKQYDVIVGVCEKIPAKTLQEIQDLVMFYDIAKERAPEKIVQFQFKWE